MAAAALRRVTDIRLAADQVLSDPRLAASRDGSDEPVMSRAEMTAGLRAAMGVARRMPDSDQATLPPVNDLARRIGLKR